MKLKLNLEIKPCNCEEGSPKTTYVDINLDGEIESISCCFCDDYEDFGHAGDTVEEWNKRKAKK